MAVSISCEFIMNEPSPSAARIRRSGWASLAAIAPGRENAIVDRPLRLLGRVEARHPHLDGARIDKDDVIIV